jgi:hypothetical protein
MLILQSSKLQTRNIGVILFCSPLSQSNCYQVSVIFISETSTSTAEGRPWPSFTQKMAWASHPVCPIPSCLCLVSCRFPREASPNLIDQAGAFHVLWVPCVSHLTRVRICLCLSLLQDCKNSGPCALLGK